MVIAQTVCDYVVATTIIKWDGTLVKLSRADDPEGFAKKIAHFGLLGVTLGEDAHPPYFACLEGRGGGGGRDREAAEGERFAYNHRMARCSQGHLELEWLCCF